MPLDVKFDNQSILWPLSKAYLFYRTLLAAKPHLNKLHELHSIFKYMKANYTIEYE